MKNNKTLTIAEILAMPLAERYALAADGVKLGKKVSETRDNFNTVTPFYAKVTAALKRDHARLLADKNSGLAPDTSFKKFFADNCGGALPGRLETLAAFFNTMCMVEDGRGNPMLAEDCYDAASVNSLEIANKVINHVKEQAQAQKRDWRADNDTLDVVNALSKPGDATKKLKAIRERQKPETTVSVDGDAVLTVESAIAFLLATVKKAGDMPVEKAAALYETTVKFNDALGDAWSESGVSEETLDRWTTNIDKGVAVDMEIKTGAPAATVPAKKELASAGK
ncbi:MAG TPA: hypothetical protein VK742_01095 [Candidatus Sulfotelmatobacter sp.]|jgi:hypothetical protein|nr:hypothetical protein [Candidatus Sulfotelmatobacter sp.]